MRVLYLILIFALGIIRAAVIAPEWADVRFNPCAKTSWQYLFWKADGKCYPIFKQGGPCPATMELVFDQKAKEAKCECPSGRVFWEEDGRCYDPYTTGPCSEGDFLHPGQEVQTRVLRVDPHRRTLHQVQAWLGQLSEPIKMEPLGFVHCKQRGFCPVNWSFWPATELCYPLNSQGPCQSGSIFRWNAKSLQVECSCEAPHPSNTSDALDRATSWRPYYWPTSATCHEHFSSGPCKLGEIFIYNQTAQATQCTCSKQMPNYHSETGLCFEKYTRGPCRPGMWLTSHSQDLPQYSVPASPRPVNTRLKTSKNRSYAGVGSNRRNGLTCTCLPGFVYSLDEDQCYREYTQGPCRSGYFIIHSQDEIGICWKNPCARQELYVPEANRCFPIYSQGNCPDGQLVLSDDQHGISYRGRCGCSALNSQYYWPDDGRCYAHETTGPCKNNLVFSLRSGQGLTPSCTCPAENVLFNGTGQCYKLFSQGPCQWNEWLVPSSSTSVNVNEVDELPPGEQYVCQCKPGYEYQSGSTFCQPPSLELLFSLPANKNSRRQLRVPSHPSFNRRRQSLVKKD